jgi:hypothetical protein
MRRAAAAILCAALAACIEVPTPKSPEESLEPKEVVTQPAMELETACIPSGMELCFDAHDNNCNGVIDEGCGLHTGILQFAIAWQEPAADVDLSVYGPDGDLAHLDKPSPGSGLMKDRDCPGPDNQCYGQNVENVYLSEGRPRTGRYRVVVRLEDPRDATPPIKVRLSIRLGQRYFSSVLVLKEKAQQQSLEFSL